MFKKVLIANRGEIAVRIVQTLQEMGICAAVVYSEPDRASQHVACADEAYPMEGATAAMTYLRGDRIVDIATSHGVDAIHPGYGFLSENAEFARQCADAGITFIGPDSATIAVMGDKTEARRRMADANVPIVPGFACEKNFDPADVAAAAEQIGYPVLIKAVSGGGGRGMRIVSDDGDLRDALAAAQREAVSAFGDGRVFLEKYIQDPRHVEFQIFGDNHGNAVHLFERECSIQRRYQKIVEESPSPGLSAELRDQMAAAAVRAARAIGYANAGTVEFILDATGQYYFLEVNTRLQVEHPVTEMLTGLDLVRMQVRVAAGEKLPVAQADVGAEGHAIECRVYAEDPEHGFVPSTGRIERWVVPQGRNIRVDSGVREGSQVSVHYDPMLAKLVVWAADREAALTRMAWALRRFVVLGVRTNLEFLQRLIDHPDFRAGRYDTHFLARHDLVQGGALDVPDEAVIAAAIVHAARSGRVASPMMTGEGDGNDGGPWRQAGRWRVG